MERHVLQVLGFRIPTSSLYNETAMYLKSFFADFSTSYLNLYARKKIEERALKACLALSHYTDFYEHSKTDLAHAIALVSIN